MTNNSVVWVYMIIIKIIFILLVVYGFIKAQQYKNIKTKKAHTNRNDKGQFIPAYKKHINGYRYIVVNDYINGSYLLKVKNNYNYE